MEFSEEQLQILLSMIKLTKGCATTLNRLVVLALKEDQLDHEATRRILKFGVSAEINMMLGFLRDLERALQHRPFDPK